MKHISKSLQKQVTESYENNNGYESPVEGTIVKILERKISLNSGRSFRNTAKIVDDSWETGTFNGPSTEFEGKFTSGLYTVSVVVFKNGCWYYNNNK